MKSNFSLHGTKHVAFGLMFLLGAGSTLAQCDSTSGFAKAACETQARLAAANSTLGPTGASASAGASQTLTTGLADAIQSELLDPSISPEAFTPLTSLDRANDGAYLLKAGAYDLTVESYSLDATSHEASGGTGGFFPAPFKGTQAVAIASILKYAELHPEIKQPQIQQLLSFIVAGTELRNMPPMAQQTAGILLPRVLLQQLQPVGRSNRLGQFIVGALNQQIMKSTAVQQALAQADSVNGTLQQTASLIGPAGLPTLPIARGTWVQMPGGFYVRYLPEAPGRIRLQVMVPVAVITQVYRNYPLTFDPTQFLAIQAQAPSQRIGISLRQVAPEKR